MVNGWMTRNWRRWLKELVVVSLRDGRGEGVLGRGERVGVGVGVDQGRKSSERRRRQRRIHGFRENTEEEEEEGDSLEKFVFSFFYETLVF